MVAGVDVLPFVHGELKARLRSDLNAATKARDEVAKATLRMALTAISTAEVAGKAPGSSTTPRW